MNNTQQVRTCLSSYETLSDVLGDYYDCEGAFAPSTPVTDALRDVSERSGLTTTETLEQLWELHRLLDGNRL